jgi:quercetin dioxygenase-like cupin family protein
MKRKSLIIVVAVAVLMLSFLTVSQPTGAHEEKTPTTLATPGVGFTSTLLVRARLNPFWIVSGQPDLPSSQIELRAGQDYEIVINQVKAVPGGHSGWHSHPGSGIVAVKSGTITVYDADDPGCKPRVYMAGSVFVEQAGHVHIARNEGNAEYEAIATFFFPAGTTATRTDAPQPTTCPF